MDDEFINAAKIVCCCAGNVFCFNTNCYSLAFGIPAILMAVAIGTNTHI